MYSIKFIEKNKKFCLSLDYNGANSYFLSMVQKFTSLNQKILKLWQAHFVLGTFQKTGY